MYASQAHIQRKHEYIFEKYTMAKIRILSASQLPAKRTLLQIRCENANSVCQASAQNIVLIIQPQRNCGWRVPANCLNSARYNRFTGIMPTSNAGQLPEQRILLYSPRNCEFVYASQALKTKFWIRILYTSQALKTKTWICNHTGNLNFERQPTAWTAHFAVDTLRKCAFCMRARRLKRSFEY